MLRASADKSPSLSLALLSQEAPTSLELNLSSLSQEAGMLLSHTGWIKERRSLLGKMHGVPLSEA